MYQAKNQQTVQNAIVLVTNPQEAKSSNAQQEQRDHSLMLCGELLPSG